MIIAIGSEVAPAMTANTVLAKKDNIWLTTPNSATAIPPGFPDLADEYPKKSGPANEMPRPAKRVAIQKIV
jgi:hypothetical protein